MNRKKPLTFVFLISYLVVRNGIQSTCLILLASEEMTTVVASWTCVEKSFVCVNSACQL